MSLNKQKGNMYGFVTHTWNTVKGKCPHDCSYCYMKRFKNQPELHFDEKEIKKQLPLKNHNILVGSSCDMWADSIPLEWIFKTIGHCPEGANTYLFQSKNPKRFLEYLNYLYFPDGTTLCTTIETNRFYDGIMGKTPHPELRSNAMKQLYMKDAETMITVEPILDFDLAELVSMIRTAQPFQVNIGADTGNNHLPEPPKEKILELIDGLSVFTTVHQKDNLRRLLKI